MLRCLAVGLFSLLVCPASARAECTSNDDCKRGRVCRAQECVDACSRDKDCPGDLVCASGACSERAAKIAAPATGVSEPGPGTPAAGMVPALKASPEVVLTSEKRMLRHFQLSQELSDLRRKADDIHWITDYVVGGSVGVGLVLAGFALDALLREVLSSSAGPIAGFWTFFGCALGGGITFAVLVVVGTVHLVQWLALSKKIRAKADELARFDAESGIQNNPTSQLRLPPVHALAGWSNPSRTWTVLRF